MGSRIAGYPYHILTISKLPEKSTERLIAYSNGLKLFTSSSRPPQTNTPAEQV
jgi:hypothetical protein